MGGEPPTGAVPPSSLEGTTTALSLELGFPESYFPLAAFLPAPVADPAFGAEAPQGA